MRSTRPVPPQVIGWRSGSGATFTRKRYAPGEYHLVVEGVYRSSAGSYVVEIMRLTLD